MARDAEAGEFAQNFCMNVVYTSTELNGESIDSILHWTIMKFNKVVEMIGKINKIKYGDKSTGSTNIRTLG